MHIKAPYLPYDELRARADRFLNQHHRERSIPVPIEEIVEFEFGMDIISLPGLQDSYETVAFITKDMSEICVDEHVMYHRENRYRFSLAHELAHRVLHQDIFAQIEFGDIAS